MFCFFTFSYLHASKSETQQLQVKLLKHTFFEVSDLRLKIHRRFCSEIIYTVVLLFNDGLQI